MKRIANNVAVATLLSTMKPQTEVKIIDVDYNLVLMVDGWESIDGLGEVLTVDEILHDYNNVQFANAKIRRTGIYNNMLMLVIDTKQEEY